MKYLEQVKRWIGEITEIALLLVALAITLEILIGSSNMKFLGGAVANLTTLINTLGDNGVVGLIALGVIFFLFHRRKVATEGHHHQ